MIWCIQNQHMLRGAYSQQLDPEQWPTPQVERYARLQRRQSRYFRFSLLFLKFFQADDVQSQSHFISDELHRLAGLDYKRCP